MPTCPSEYVGAHLFTRAGTIMRVPAELMLHICRRVFECQASANLVLYSFSIRPDTVEFMLIMCLRVPECKALGRLINLCWTVNATLLKGSVKTTKATSGTGL